MWFTSCYFFSSQFVPFLFLLASICFVLREWLKDLLFSHVVHSYPFSFSFSFLINFSFFGRIWQTAFQPNKTNFIAKHVPGNRERSNMTFKNAFFLSLHYWVFSREMKNSWHLHNSKHVCKKKMTVLNIHKRLARVLLCS
jgi:hypothetical protein